MSRSDAPIARVTPSPGIVASTLFLTMAGLALRVGSAVPQLRCVSEMLS